MMLGSFRVGSILGFEIRIDYSWFIIYFLLLWTFGTVVFPNLYPDLTTGAYVAMAVAGTLLFFASLIAHELSHSLVARRKGMPVTGITLFVLGGMAHTAAEFEKPGDEFQVAAAGPLASLLIGAGFWLLAQVGEALGWAPAVVGVSSYLALVNVVLAVFNLLPGFPLDGGRIFRSIVWRVTADLRKATRFAANGGKLIGFLLLGLGILNFFAGNLIGGVWMAFIGMFMRSAADASYQQLVLRRSLEGVRAADVMTREVYTVPGEISIDEFVDQHIFQGRHHTYPVEVGGSPVGIVTLARIRKVPRPEWSSRTVVETMAPLEESMIVRPDERMDRVLDRLGQSEPGRVLVQEDGRLVGIITRGDLARWMERLQLLESS